MSKCSLAFLLLGVSLPSLSFAQVQQDSSYVAQSDAWLEASALLSGPRTPFWLQSNQYGTVPRTGSALRLGGGGKKIWSWGQVDSLSNWTKGRVAGTAAPWQAEVGGEAVVNLGSTSRLLLPQAYGAIRYRNLELLAGRRRQLFGLSDSTLGTGSYIWSGNALPMPRIQMGLTKYTPVPFTKGFFSVLGSYSEAWFEGGRPVTSELKLHQKQLYGRLGKANGRLKFYAGVNHQVQWGGKSPYETKDGQMPKGIKDYLYLILGKKRYKSSNATPFDNMNRVGNHLGTIDLALEIDGSRANWFLYRQNLYEDGSLYYLTNIADGLNGIRIRRKNAKAGSGFKIKEIVFEGLYTKSQGGASFIIDEEKKRGRDNYFNHTQVRDGWSYYDRTIGTPFIPPTSETAWKFPNYADAFTSNNRVWVLHLGLQGELPGRIQWMSKLSYSSNDGVYDQSFPTTAHQFSALLALQARTAWLGGMTAKGSIATDRGGLYPNSVGAMFSLRKDFGPPPPARPANYRWR